MHKAALQLRSAIRSRHSRPGANPFDIPAPPDKLAGVISSPPFVSLVRMGCSAVVLRNALHRFANACVQPNTKRKAFKRTGVTEKQIRQRVKEARDLLGFLRRLQTDVPGLASDMPPDKLFPWRMTLEEIAGWLARIRPLRLDPIEAALVIVLHVKETTGRKCLATDQKKHVIDILMVARDTVGATAPHFEAPESFDKALRRATPADRKRAHDLLRSWKLLAIFPLH